jgi:hypothetical protein
MSAFALSLKFLVLALCLGAAPGWAQPFSFVALGDLPYGPESKAGPPYRALIAAINRSKPAFSIHVGDIKSGSSVCSDDEYLRQRTHFSLFEAGVVYTPGDNEWADCHRASNGGFDPEERLQTLRGLFFTPGRSLGQRPIFLQNQSALMPAHAGFVENQRWMHRQVMFVTVHVVGGNNQWNKREPRSQAELARRDQANLAWLKDSFAQARSRGARALVVAMQANPLGLFNVFGRIPEDSAYHATIAETLLPLAMELDLPVLLIHGDTHTFRWDSPFRRQDQSASRVMRLEVPGSSDVRAVQVGVDLDRPQPFSVALIQAD